MATMATMKMKWPGSHWPSSSFKQQWPLNFKRLFRYLAFSTISKNNGIVFWPSIPWIFCDLLGLPQAEGPFSTKVCSQDALGIPRASSWSDSQSDGGFLLEFVEKYNNQVTIKNIKFVKKITFPDVITFYPSVLLVYPKISNLNCGKKWPSFSCLHLLSPRPIGDTQWQLNRVVGVCIQFLQEWIHVSDGAVQRAHKQKWRQCLLSILVDLRM